MIEAFTRHRTAADLLMVALVAMGLVSLGGLRRETMPDFAAAEVEVRVVYPGASAAEVEEAVCVPLEEAVEGIDGALEVRSEAREGLGSVVLQATEGTDVSRLLADVKREVDASAELPEASEAPSVSELGFRDRVVSVAVTAEGADPIDLEAYCQQLARGLRNDAGVRLVEVAGFGPHQLRVELLGAALDRHALSVDEVADVIASQSVDAPVGTVRTEGHDVLLRVTEQRRSAGALERIVVVPNATGGDVLLGELGRVVPALDHDERKILVGGQRAGLLEIQKTKAEDALEVFAAVEAFLEREERAKPPGVRFTLMQDTASVVEDRLLMLVENGWQGMLLVFLALTLFFPPRFSFWVAMGIPVSFMGALFCMHQLGLSVNMISMVGLLLALGLLMDDAIVLAESVALHHEQGLGAVEAAVAGVRKVGIGVLSSFLTTCAVFGPLAFIDGDIGKVLRVMPMVLILVLAVSLVEAFLSLPRHLGHALSGSVPGNQGALHRRVDRILDTLRERVLGRCVDAAVRWRYLSVGALVFALLASGALLVGGGLRFEAFPDVDGDVVEARVLLPQGTPLERTEAVTERLDAALRRVSEELRSRQPDGEDVVQSVAVFFDRNVDAGESGPHVATVVGNLLTAERRAGSADEILTRWREEAGGFPGAISLVFTEPSYGPAGRPIQLRLSGVGLDELGAASRELRGWLEGVDGVLHAFDDLRPGKPEARLRLREGAAALGQRARSLAAQVQAGFQGSVAQETRSAGEPYEVVALLAETERTRLRDLERFEVALPDGTRVPLSSVAYVEEGRGYARIARVDGARSVTVTGDIDTDRVKTSELVPALETSFLPGLLERYPGLRVEVEGEQRETATTMGSMQRALGAGLLGVFLLLSFQFRSYSEPFLVLLAIPMCLVGVIWGHWLMGFDLTMTSALGFASLAGVVVNDSILLVEFTKLGRSEGLGAADAAMRASRARFRAVLLTSLTTVLGLTPLLFETSLQAQFLLPLAGSIVFGMIASTLLVLLALPALYAVLDDLGLAGGPDPDTPH
ncbi:MAG: efflux RND transporter permease subunit [Planctomycetota bacterium]